MIRALVDNIAQLALRTRQQRLERYITQAVAYQDATFRNLIEQGRRTQWGHQYRYGEIQTPQQFAARVPVSPYEVLYPYIARTLAGEANVLWPGVTKWFAKSSGTTNDRSKFIPLTPQSLKECHFKAGRDLMAAYLAEVPKSGLLGGRALGIGGSHEISHFNPHARYGDLSAVLTENLPWFYEWVRTPSKRTAMLADWETKIERMKAEVMAEDVRIITGVPTWTLVLLRALIDHHPESQGDITRLWPNLEVFFHGGVSFTPYRPQFKAINPNGQLRYCESYNASEGFFALQNELNRSDLLLMPDHGIYFEFIALEDLDHDSLAHTQPPSVPLEGVEVGRTYALVISTNGGLWRYLIGDTVRFTSRNPFKLVVSGRTKHFINAFGEELMVDNTDQALAKACESTNASIRDYTAAPIYITGNQSGAHEWVIEFEHPPAEPQHFMHLVDQHLRTLNTDYDAKRQHDIALGPPRLHVAPSGTFYEWMKQKGKLGGQNKVPRLANTREYLESVLNLLADNQQYKK